jgi:exodeoxyribonuclease VII large subunit
MSDLFDLPFEEEEPEPEPDAPGARGPTAAPSASEEVRRRASESDAARGTGPSDQSLTRPVLTVTELTLRVRDLLETELFEVWVEGELSNCRIWNTGHLYFTLKDSASQLRGFMFRSVLRYLKFKPADGLRVVARGRISVYEPKGEYQLVCEHLEPQGLGALQLAFDQLKKRLQREGLFDPARKRPLPALPRKIGIVTSLDGAAIRDIIKVLRRRYANAHLVIRAARVQGDGAAPEIARGLRAIGRVRGVDVVIVGRGGGSIEDLWAFNEEIVARAIVQCPVPVIAAVGHETDVTIADFVADVRAPTPSAAAELVVSRKEEFCGRIDRLEDRLRAATRGRVQSLSRRVHLISSRPAFAGMPGRVAMAGRHATELTHTLARIVRGVIAARARGVQHLERQLTTFDAGRRLAALRTRLVAATGTLTSTANRRHDRARAELHSVVGRLETLSPLAVLGRGYAVCWNADRTEVVRDADRVRAGDAVRVTLARGELDCEVRATAVEPHQTTRTRS